MILKKTAAEGSDYINASWINVTNTCHCYVHGSVELFFLAGLSKEKGIHCSTRYCLMHVHSFPVCRCIKLSVCNFDTGPKEETVEDFWRMISENELTTIVMVTKLIEGPKVSLFCCIITSELYHQFFAK